MQEGALNFFFINNTFNLSEYFVFLLWFIFLSSALYEESSEFKVAVFDLNVPWAQQAETKSLIAGYQNQTLLFKYIINLA